MLTTEQSHALAIRPLPQTHIAYRGHVWAGIQVTDSFQADVNSGQPDTSTETSRHYLPRSTNIMHRIAKSQEYDGIYRDAVNISMSDAQALFGDTE